jgi:hypothetical protein
MACTCSKIDSAKTAVSRSVLLTDIDEALSLSRVLRASASLLASTSRSSLLGVAVFVAPESIEAALKSCAKSGIGTCSQNNLMKSKTPVGGEERFSHAELSDSLDALTIAPSYDVREGRNFIDEDGALELPVGSDSDKEEVEEEPEESSGYDSQMEAAAWEESLTRVDDEDWEIAERGMYKSYPRCVLNKGTD